MNNALKKSVDRILDLAINEDQTKLDLTSSLTLTNKKIKADVVFKEKGILSGIDIINHLVKKYNNKIFIKWRHKNGDKINKFEKSINSYSQAILLDPEDYKTFYQLGMSYKSNKLFKQSLDAFKKSVKLNPCTSVLLKIGCTVTVTCDCTGT